MAELKRDQSTTLGALLALLVLTAAVVWFAPDERTLGEGIKIVYIHLTLTWAGMLGFIASGLLGLLTVFAPSPATWSRNLARVALAWFVV